jgi:hypothetical protein
MQILLDNEFRALFTAAVERMAAAYYASQPAPAPVDPWLTIPEAAAYARMTPSHMRLLVLGRPYRASTPERPERQGILSKIPSGDTGFGNGTRVRQSAIDEYLMRFAYRKHLRKQSS